mmetsp:Transcript_45149/g.145277  ORF Transcript_45149/g.145277 Transcript_45149/m.145277 type:complete len:213 (-) Transcript_45149:780-1418(-)
MRLQHGKHLLPPARQVHHERLHLLRRLPGGPHQEAAHLGLALRVERARARPGVRCGRAVPAAGQEMADGLEEGGHVRRGDGARLLGVQELHQAAERGRVLALVLGEREPVRDRAQHRVEREGGAEREGDARERSDGVVAHHGLVLLLGGEALLQRAQDGLHLRQRGLAAVRAEHAEAEDAVLAAGGVGRGGAASRVRQDGGEVVAPRRLDVV